MGGAETAVRARKMLHVSVIPCVCVDERVRARLGVRTTWRCARRSQLIEALRVATFASLFRPFFTRKVDQLCYAPLAYT